MSNCSRRKRDDMREEDQTPTTIYPYNNCFLLCHNLSNQYTMHSPTSSFTLSHKPSTSFPHSYATFHSSLILRNSSSHSPAPQFCTHYPTAPVDCSQIPHNPLGNEPYPSYSTITHHTPLITNYSTFFLSSNNPIEPVFSLINNLTLS